MFHVGQRVKCIDDAFTPERFIQMVELGMQAPVKGQVYTIRKAWFEEGEYGLLLTEIINPKHHFSKGLLEPGFYGYRFRTLLPGEMKIQEALEEMACLMKGSQ